jgi:hypothetical protein
MTFHFPLDKLAQEPYDVVAWHLLFLIPQRCLALFPRAEVTKHKEMMKYKIGV